MTFGLVIVTRGSAKESGVGLWSDAMIRVMLVDEQPLFRAGLASLLETSNEIDVVAQVASCVDALTACQQQQPHVVLMDMRMPGIAGPECTRLLLERCPDTRVIALSTFDDDETVFAAIRAGAAGYLLKDVTCEVVSSSCAIVMACS